MHSEAQLAKPGNVNSFVTMCRGMWGLRPIDLGRLSRIHIDIQLISELNVANVAL